MTKCSECGNYCEEESCYVSKETGKIICVFCLAKIKKERLKNYVKKP